jgi:hypothetical protein
LSDSPTKSMTTESCSIAEPSESPLDDAEAAAATTEHSHTAHDEQAVGDVSKCDDAARARARLGGAGSAIDIATRRRQASMRWPSD